MNNEISSSEKGKAWIKKHPIITSLLVLFLIIFIAGISTGDSSDTAQKTESVTSTPETFEDRIKELVAKRIGTTDVTFKGIDDEKADSDRPGGSRMVTVKFNVTSFYKASSLYRDTSELTAKAFREVFTSNGNVYDVIVWYYGEKTDKYGNKSDGVILSMAIDKATYQKINWQNFDSSTLCDFLKSEGRTNGGETACVALATIE